MSELSIGLRGWVQIANFLSCGALFLLFARGVAAEFPTGKASRGGPMLLALIGLSLMASGPLVTNLNSARHGLAPSPH